MVTFISQCEKNALKKTRRVLDAFADRIGDNTWQTVITEDGLNTVKKMLRQTASKSTAVSCHWIRSRSRSELIWVVGNRSRFNEQGIVPVNFTSESLATEESFSMNTEVIALLACVAGFFHDIGKAMLLFQNKLDPYYQGKGFEPYRHEWVSFRLFQAFVNGKKDIEWLNELKDINNESEEIILRKLQSLRDGVVDEDIENPFISFEPIAKIVAWLIVSHHRLPQYPKGKNPPALKNIDQWLNTYLEASWNSPQCLNDDWDIRTVKQNWQFPYGTPFKSALWQTHVSIVAEKTLKLNRIFSNDWLEQRFTAHMARLSLMLSDHYYSSPKKEKLKEVTPEWQDKNYQAFANTGKNPETGKKYKKQKLDEHNIAVGIFAAKIARQLPKLKSTLPPLKSNNSFTKPIAKEFKQEFGWQDHAFTKAEELREESKAHGFFGINMASTGKGKTLANARIMYGLSDENQCRFSVALGLRTLTLQTGDALRKNLKLSYEELAVLIGSQAVKDLHQLGNNQEHSIEQEEGCESAESLLKDEVQLHHALPEFHGSFSEWIEHDEKILKLIQSPVLISTIDYLVPATDSLRGGRQIAPMLRLLTSDLVLDEPDDFGLEDLPALCRLVNWAGMLGSRVLLSTATISPELASALFDAYQQGRKHYTQVNGEKGETSSICCAWFDEFKKPESYVINALDHFNTAHKAFIDKRIGKLNGNDTGLRKAKIIPVEADKNIKPSQAFARTIHSSIGSLHQKNFVEHKSKKKVSIGLIRMANIDPLVAVSQYLLASKAEADTKIYYCIYHSQYPLVLRSQIEQNLDKALSRHNEKHWWTESGIEEKISNSEITHHIFVVLATSVAEVGRDHDYDWAIVEPSSMRSIIQLAGRIQRHRKQEPNSENIHILDKNFKGLRGISPCYLRPGFESESRLFFKKELSELLDESEYHQISAIPRIQNVSTVTRTKTIPPKFMKFNELEHITQHIRLFGNSNEENFAKLWWSNNVTWCGEIQRNQPFRKSEPMDDYNLNESYHQKLIWQKKRSREYPAKYDTSNDIEMLDIAAVKIAPTNAVWFDMSVTNNMEHLMSIFKISKDYAYKKFFHIQLRENSNDEISRWKYHEHLGVYKELKKDEYIDEQ